MPSPLSTALARGFLTSARTTFFAYKLEYYDTNGELHRINILKDYRELGKGKYFAFYMEMRNVKNNRRSVMSVDKFQMGSAMPEAQFSPTMLEQ